MYEAQATEAWLSFCVILIITLTRTLTKGLCKVKKIPKIQKKFGSGWVGPGLIWIKKKIGKSSKKKVLRLYNSSQYDPCGAAASNQRLVLVDMLSAAITS